MSNTLELSRELSSKKKSPKGEKNPPLKDISKTLKIEGIPFYKEDRVALFIDGANLYATARALNLDINYKNLRSWFSNQSRLVRSFYYTALLSDQEYSPIKPLLDWLSFNGFTLVTKPAGESFDAEGKKKLEGNMDVDITLDMMEMASTIDHMILFSASPNLLRTIESLQKKGIRVTLVSTLKSKELPLSEDLRRRADHFLDLMLLAPYIGKSYEDPAQKAPQKQHEQKKKAG